MSANAADAMRGINQAWLNGQVEELAPLIHPEIVMVFPGFSGRMQGKEDFLAGFHDFCRNAKVHEFHEREQHVDVAGKTAVITFLYEMAYERSGQQYRSSGRDLWVFEKQCDGWLAVWRAMLDMQETAI